MNSPPPPSARQRLDELLVTRGLFAGDLQRHWQSLLDYDVKQVELDWNRMGTG